MQLSSNKLNTGELPVYSDITSLKRKIDIAIATVEVVEEMGKLSLELREKGLEVTIKHDESKVTNADVKISEILDIKLPLIEPAPVVSEENTNKININDIDLTKSYWLVDPIDSTSSYIEGYSGFCIMLSLVQNGEQLLSVVGAPAHDLVYYAIKGLGSFKYDTEEKSTNQIHASFVGEKLKVATPFHGSETDMRRLKKGLSINNKEIETEKVSSGLKYCFVADGQFAAAGSIPVIKSWDANPALIVIEAGGAISSEGNEIVFTPNGALKSVRAFGKGIDFQP